MYLENEGYDVMAVSNAADAREVLDLFVPSLLVAEIEGQGDERPGYDLCGHVKATWRSAASPSCSPLSQPIPAIIPGPHSGRHRLHGQAL